MEEEDIYSAEVGDSEFRQEVGSSEEDVDAELSTRELNVLVTGTTERRNRESRTNMLQDRSLEERKQINPPKSTFQRFSVDTNEYLRFDPCVPSEKGEPRQLRPCGGKLALYSDEVFEKQESGMEDGTEIPEDSEQWGGMEGGLTRGNVQDPSYAFCADCKTSTLALKKLFGPHKDHRVILMPKAAEEIKEVLKNTTRKLGEHIVLMENFASHLEEIFITVEENFGRQEQNLEQHYNDVLQALSQRYDQGASRLQDEKKLKLEGLYSQLVDCGKTLDSSKELIETAQEIYRKEDKLVFLKELTKGEPDLQLSASTGLEKPAADFSDVKQMMDSINIVPAPSAPVINPQASGSATPTSVRVCWSLFSDDTVDYYELHYRPVLEDTAAEGLQAPEASMVKVKETYRTVSSLRPNGQYEFWVTATNTTGASPASEKAVYMTVPSPPILRQRECISSLEATLIRWESGNTNPVDSYTVELNEIGGDRADDSVTESIVAVPTCECLIQLQSGKAYSVCVRAVNIGGPSERSEAVTVQTMGTFVRLLEDTAHPFLSISQDGLTMVYREDDLALSDITFSDNTFARCVAVLGELIPVRGRHYWEVKVDEATEFRIGVAYEDTQRNGFLGGNTTSWCMRHVITPSRHKYEFLHNGWTPDVRITCPPQRIGVALDYEAGSLSFSNAGLSQHLYTFHCQFLHLAHPCFALESPGALTVCHGIPAPGATLPC